MSPKVSRPRTSGNWASVGTSRLLTANCGFELGPLQRRTEDRTAGLEDAAGAKAVQPDGVVADPLDDVRHHVHRRCIVSRYTDGTAVRGADRSALVLEVVVADLVQRLDDRGPGEPVGDDLAAAALGVLEQFLYAVNRRPVVHRVDHDPVGHQGGIEGREPV